MGQVQQATLVGAIDAIRTSSAPIAIALYGPTAIGKTALAMALVDAFAAYVPVRLISVDSALVYRDMDIGTGKPTATELARYPHELVNLIDPAQRYSAAQFVESAKDLFAEATQAGEVPVFVGGTMLYFKALRDGLAELPEADPELRLQLQQELLQSGSQALHAQLTKVDPQAAKQIAPSNTQRLLRAIEVQRLTGLGISAFWQLQRERATLGPLAALGGRLLEFGLVPRVRTQLHERIDERFDHMIVQGFVEEVKGLRARGDLSLELPSMRSVGYRQIWQHLDDAVGFDEACRMAKTATRKLAKRQLTWMRGWQGLPQTRMLECGSDPIVALRPLLESCKSLGVEP